MALLPTLSPSMYEQTHTDLEMMYYLDYKTERSRVQTQGISFERNTVW